MATPAKGRSRKTTPAVAVAEAGSAELQNIVDATIAGNFVYTASSIHTPLIEAGLVEINEAITNEAGEIATRATQKGIEAMSKNNESPAVATEAAAPVAETPAAAPAVAAGGFKIDDAIPVPTISGRGRGGNVYPFDAMAVGQSFFVANTADKPNAAKSLASTVSSATARYAVPSPDGKTKTNKAGETVPVMVETRKFVVRSVEENGVKGARVWRTA